MASMFTAAWEPLLALPWIRGIDGPYQIQEVFREIETTRRTLLTAKQENHGKYHQEPNHHD